MAGLLEEFRQQTILDIGLQNHEVAQQMAAIGAIEINQPAKPLIRNEHVAAGQITMADAVIDLDSAMVAVRL